METVLARLARHLNLHIECTELETQTIQGEEEGNSFGNRPALLIKNMVGCAVNRNLPWTSCRIIFFFW